ncbi:MAG: MFS transporter [Clostridia bacterium]|nr:MFS transporter [Clostridia bacterium]
MKKLGYRHTVNAAFGGYIVQALLNNFLPLLFVRFHAEFGISFAELSLLVLLNFVVQIGVDALSPILAVYLGYRRAVYLANLAAILGLCGLAAFPTLFCSPFLGLLLSVLLYALGSGIIEVVISGIIESIPSENKHAAMSLLHSFYCWGVCLVVLLSTLFFATVGVAHWRLLTLLWAILPLCDLVYFTRVDIPSPAADKAGGVTLGRLFSRRVFWVFFVMMICAGACEQAIVQWVSAYAELALGLQKTVGDLFGPLGFAVFMGLSRVIFARRAGKLRLRRYMLFSALLCLAGYLCAALCPIAWLSLFGCILCGFAVGILWPGTYSLAAERLRGGTLMFACLALAGDLGCTGGPSAVGFITDAFSGNMRLGILLSIVFPIGMLVALTILDHMKSEEEYHASRK